jgi:hypothetical protein
MGRQFAALWYNNAVYDPFPRIYLLKSDSLGNSELFVIPKLFLSYNPLSLPH